MGASMSIDISALNRLIDRVDSPILQAELNAIPQSKAIAAIVAQAIADNFAQEGPGWAPLKGETLRRSVAKGVLRVAQLRAADAMGALKITGKEGKQSLNRKALKGSMADFHKRTGRELEKIEASLRTKHAKAQGAVVNRMILQDTGLLKRASTTITQLNGTFTSKNGVTARNVYSVQGNMLYYGVNLTYAATHQYGDPAHNIPARPYLVVREQWMAQIQNFMVEKVMKLIVRAINGGG